MSPSSELTPISSGLAVPPTGSLARPSLPRSTCLSPDRIRAVDLEEQMDPLAVAEATPDRGRSIATITSQAVVIAVAATAIWWLLPRGVTARPPLELPPALQSEAGPLPPGQSAAESEAVALLRQASPSRALEAFRGCVESATGASVSLWRYYLQTLVDLDERREPRVRAAEFIGRHPDRLEAAHFLCEAIRRDSIDAHRDRRGTWNTIRGVVSSPPVSEAYLAEVERCQGTITDALVLLQQHDDDWSAGHRTAWADLLHLDRARLHWHAWACGGFAFEDPHREEALTAIRQLSAGDSADALALKLDIYRACRSRWPSRLGFPVKRQIVNGLDWSREDLDRAIVEARVALDRLPPLGRR